MRPEEIAKYVACYRHSNYRMAKRNRLRALKDIESIPVGSTYLDVGCGRGETVALARRRGVDASGVELVPALCDGTLVFHASATALPFDQFDYVSCYDVLEHLPPEEVEAGLDELFRVAGKVLFITTNDRHARRNGVELHLTRRPRAWWEKRFADRAPTARIVHTTFATESDWHWRIEIARQERLAIQTFVRPERR